MRSVVDDKMGAHVKSYPAQLRFRVTANAHDVISDDQFLAYKSDADINTLLLGLHFLLKAFDGLTEQEFSPSLVRHIGVPEGVPSDERIYDVHFDIGKLPCERRLVLELADGNGVRLAKFHLESM